MITALTKSPDDTREMGALLAALARAGDLILLSGDLGAGKTTFAQGFGQGLGVEEPIVSPTFVLMRSYTGSLPLVHCDVYRLDRLQEVIDLGLPEVLDEGAVALVEWGDVAAPSLPADYLEVRLAFADGDDDRHVEMRAVGPSWWPRWEQVTLAFSRWQPAP